MKLTYEGEVSEIHLMMTRPVIISENYGRLQARCDPFTLEEVVDCFLKQIPIDHAHFCKRAGIPIQKDPPGFSA